MMVKRQEVLSDWLNSVENKCPRFLEQNFLLYRFDCSVKEEEPSRCCSASSVSVSLAGVDPAASSSFLAIISAELTGWWGISTVTLFSECCLQSAAVILWGNQLVSLHSMRTSVPDLSHAFWALHDLKKRNLWEKHTSCSTKCCRE